MTWNPCGCVVDWSRRPFDCDAQPFADSSQVVRVRFYPAAPGAKAIPFPSNIYVPDWDFDKEWWEPPGTVPAEWPGNPFNRAKSVPGSGAGHVCGTEEQFAGEAPLDPDADMQYRPDGLPVCCDPREELAGGAGGAPLDGLSVSGGPGPSCPLAAPLSVGVPYTYLSHALIITDVEWWKYTLTPGANYRLTTFTSDDAEGGFVTVWKTDCFTILGSASAVGPSFTHGHIDFVGPTDGEVRVSVQLGGSVFPSPFTITLDMEPH